MNNTRNSKFSSHDNESIEFIVVADWGAEIEFFPADGYCGQPIPIDDLIECQDLGHSGPIPKEKVAELWAPENRVFRVLVNDREGLVQILEEITSVRGLAELNIYIANSARGEWIHEPGKGLAVAAGTASVRMTQNPDGLPHEIAVYDNAKVRASLGATIESWGGTITAKDCHLKVHGGEVEAMAGCYIEAHGGTIMHYGTSEIVQKSKDATIIDLRKRASASFQRKSATQTSRDLNRSIREQFEVSVKVKGKR